jgi:hypothetical protein
MIRHESHMIGQDVVRKVPIQANEHMVLLDELMKTLEEIRSLDDQGVSECHTWNDTNFS